MKCGFIIPVYRHGSALFSVVESLQKYSLPIIIVDDGNDDENKKLIETCAKRFSAYLVSLKRNSGKGKAFWAGVKKAMKLGLSHVFQIDADGQHDSNACADFLQQALINPDALLCGYPEYDETVPSARKNGREFSNKWARFVSWDLSIKDVLCGFRLYPMAGLKKLFRKRFFINSRMGFDVDILVRLSWLGEKIISFPVAVTYPEDGVSNFRMVRDNITISFTFTKLCVGMILRSPVLLFRLIKRRFFSGK